MDVEMDEPVNAFAKGKEKVIDDGDDTWHHQDSIDQLKSSASESINVTNHNINSSNSDLSYHDNDFEIFDVGDDDDDCADEDGDNDDYVSNYDDDEYLFEEDDYLAIQSQFDNVDLPTGVEASLPWLKEPTSTAAGTSTSTVHDSSESKRKSSILDNADAKRKAIGSLCLPENKSSVAASTSSSSVATAESSCNEEVVDNVENGIVHKFNTFKQFDTVEDFSDHHYSNMNLSDQQSPDPRGWAKRIQEEWKILENDLPDTISVRVCESRMELLRAVIVGPAGTPYHDGLFVFDCFFPSTYPNTPPMVYYYSGGLRLNPNLYECGKVCLSLLGTWSGKQNEMWIPGTSTMLQVLVSIQALILNAKPFFNEPGYETSYVGEDGERKSRKYSEDVFILSLKTMIYTIRRPPKYFEDFVIGHFHIRAHDILVACKAYVDGATVGSVAVKDGLADINNAERQGSQGFRQTLKRMFNALITNFTKYGSIDCEKFRNIDSK